MRIEAPLSTFTVEEKICHRSTEQAVISLMHPSDDSYWLEATYSYDVKEERCVISVHSNASRTGYVDHRLPDEVYAANLRLIKLELISNDIAEETAPIVCDLSEENAEWLANALSWDVEQWLAEELAGR